MYRILASLIQHWRTRHWRDVTRAAIIRRQDGMIATLHAQVLHLRAENQDLAARLFEAEGVADTLRCIAGRPAYRVSVLPRDECGPWPPSGNTADPWARIGWVDHSTFRGDDLMDDEAWV